MQLDVNQQEKNLLLAALDNLIRQHGLKVSQPATILAAKVEQLEEPNGAASEG